MYWLHKVKYISIMSNFFIKLNISRLICCHWNFLFMPFSPQLPQHNNDHNSLVSIFALEFLTQTQLFYLGIPYITKVYFLSSQPGNVAIIKF